MQFAYRKYRVAVSLTAGQVRLVDSYRVAQRHVYNWAVSRIKASGDEVTEYGLHSELTALRRTHEWMRAVPVCIQRAGIRDAFTAHKTSIKNGRVNLRYRTKKLHSGISVKCHMAPRVADGHTIRLPSFGAVRVPRMSNEMMEHDPRSYEFVRTRSGRYVLHVSCRINTPDVKCNGTVKGIDRGTVEPTTVATMRPDGSVVSKDCYDTSAPFKSNLSWYQNRQRMLSKMSRRSNRFCRLHARIRRRMQKVANRRTYAECIAAKHVCDDHDPAVIVLEDLRLGAMTRRGRGKRGMNREMRFVRHYAIEQRIRNRAELAGIRIITVDPRHTSQTCARCGHVDKKSRITRDAFKCTKCSYAQHADVNAALNIGRSGLPPSDHMGQAARIGGWNPFVRRQLDARLNCFVEGPTGCKSQASARSLARQGMEKQRQSATVVFARDAQRRAGVISRIGSSSPKIKL